MALEAFKAGAYDFRIEPSPKSWATQYQGGNFARNYIIKQDEKRAAQNTRWLAFNLQNRCSPIVGYGKRSAAFDFNWMNKALYYNAYQRADSYFQNTAYAARSYPDAAELALLAPLKGQCRRRCSPASTSRPPPTAAATIGKIC